MARAYPPEPIARLACAYVYTLTEQEREVLSQALSEGRIEVLSGLQRFERVVGLFGDPEGEFDPIIRAELASALGATSAPLSLPERIHQMCETGSFDGITELIDDAGGAFLSLIVGLDQSKRVSAQIPDHVRQSSPTLQLLDAVNATKSGLLGLAEKIVKDGLGYSEPLAIEDLDPGTDLSLTVFLFMKAIYSDEPVSKRALETLFSTLERLEGQSALLHGLIYNVGLDVFLRLGDAEMAEETASRALYHFDRIGAPGLSAYILFYLSVIHLDGGRPEEAGRSLQKAAQSLGAFGGSTENDQLILKSLELIQLYETGNPDPLVAHLTSDDQTIPLEELWPAMAEPILGYGRRALASEVSPSSALDWVRKWRLKQLRSQQFEHLISMHEAAALQASGRHHEADEVLGSISGRVSPSLGLVRVRSDIEHAARSALVTDKLKKAVADPRQRVRDLLEAHILLSRVMLANGSEVSSVQHLSDAIQISGLERLPMFWREQRNTLALLKRNRLFNAELQKRPQLRRKINQVIAKDAAVPAPVGLTEKEHRVFLLMAEGLPNKLIAQRLGVTVATVKFHVGKLLRKTGASGRRELAHFGEEAGWTKTIL